MPFATGLGAGGDTLAALPMLCVIAACGGGALVGLMVAATYRGKRKWLKRWLRAGSLLVFLLVLLSCTLGPRVHFSLVHGRAPLPDCPRLAKGMTEDEVRDVLGPPHEVGKSWQPPQWVYYFGSALLPTEYIVRFDADGRVEHAFRAD